MPSQVLTLADAFGRQIVDKLTGSSSPTRLSRNFLKAQGFRVHADVGSRHCVLEYPDGVNGDRANDSVWSWKRGATIAYFEELWLAERDILIQCLWLHSLLYSVVDLTTVSGWIVSRYKIRSRCLKRDNKIKSQEMKIKIGFNFFWTSQVPVFISLFEEGNILAR